MLCGGGGAVEEEIGTTSQIGSLEEIGRAGVGARKIFSDPEGCPSKF